MPHPGFPFYLVAPAAWLALMCAPAAAQDAPEPFRLASALHTPDWLMVSGSARLRYESLDGQARAGLSNSDQFLSTKTTLLVEARAAPFRFGAEVFDARGWLSDPDSGIGTGEVNTLEPVQLYAAAAFGPDRLGGELILGRQTLNLASRRLVSSEDYRNTATSYTGARVDLRTDQGATATLLYVMPQVRLPSDLPSLRDNDFELDRESDDLVLFGGVVTVPAFLPRAAAQATYFRLTENDRPDLATRDRRLHTWGLRYWREPAVGAFDFDVEAFAQTGSIRASTAATAAALDVSAWFLHAEAGYQWDIAWAPRLALELDVASGDEPGGKYGRFDTLFGMRRPEIAPSGLYGAVGRFNISAPGVRIEVTPTARLDAHLTWKPLSLESAFDSFSTSNVRDVAGAAGDFAGHQFDTRIRYWLVPDSLRLELNAIYLAKGRFYRLAPNTPGMEDTEYVSITLSTLF